MRLFTTILGILVFSSAAMAATPVERTCKNLYAKEIVHLKFTGKKVMSVSKGALKCKVHLDETYPNARVPKQYQGWRRFYEQKREGDSDRTMCTELMGEYFYQLRLDGRLLSTRFRGEARMQIDFGGDSAGPQHNRYVCH